MTNSENSGYLETDAYGRLIIPKEMLARYGVKPGDFIRLRVGGPYAMTFDRVLVRVSPDFKLEVHIDTDEANACGLGPDTPCELVP